MPSHAYVEYVGPRPGEGAVQGFTFGRAKGLTEGILATLNVAVTFITAPAWKRSIGIAPGKIGTKDAARSEAIRRWPDKASLFARVKDDGRAEAGLIAVAGLMRNRTTHRKTRAAPGRHARRLHCHRRLKCA